MSQSGQIPTAHKASLFDGPSTYESSSPSLSPAERSFFQLLSRSSVTQKRTMLDKVLKSLKSALPHNEEAALLAEREERKALEGAVQQKITQIIRSAPEVYFYDELYKRLQTELDNNEKSPLPDGVKKDFRRLAGEMNKLFSVTSYMAEVSLLPEQNKTSRRQIIAEKDTGYDKPAEQVACERVENLITSIPTSLTYINLMKPILLDTLGKSRDKILMYEAAVAEIGNAEVKAKLSERLNGHGNGVELTPEMTFFTAWKSGNLYHTKPVLKTTQDAEAFAQMLAGAWKFDTSSEGIDEKSLPSAQIERVCKRFAQRIYKYDQQLGKEVRERPSHPRVSGGTAPEPQKVQMPALVESPTPRLHNFTLPRESEEIMYQLGKHAQSPAKSARNALVLTHASQGVLDAVTTSQDDGERELATMLLCPANLLSAARAMDADASVKGHKSSLPPPREGIVQHLHLLYAASPAVHQLVDQFMQDERVLLLAAMAYGPEKSKNAVRAHLSITQTRDTLAQSVLTQRNVLDDLGLSDAQLQKEFAGDRSVEKLLRDQARLDELNRSATSSIANMREAVLDAIGGRKARKIVAADASTSIMQPEAHVPPEAWKPSLDHEFTHEPSAENLKYAIVRSKTFPYMTREMRYTASNAELQKNIQSLREECEYHRANMELIEGLGKECGFQINSDTGKKVIRHREYGIAVPLAAKEAELACQLVAARKRFDERQFEQESLMQQAQQAGITVKPVKYLSEAGFAHLHALLREAHGQITPAAELPKQSNGDKAHEGEFLWQPNKGETLIIFDTSMLKKFGVPRGGNGHTWLDMVKATARLPNVRVIIPEVIAEWEMQGSVPKFDPAGKKTGNELIDTHYNNEKNYLSYQADAMRQFLNCASYGTLRKDEGIFIREGMNKNIIVMATPEDKSLYQKIRAINHGPAREVHEKLKTQINHKDEGEKSIDRIVKGLPFKTPVIIVSDDLRYLNTVAPFTTGSGSSVSHASSGDYFNAELSAGMQRAYALAREMKSGDPITLADLAADSRQFQSKYGNNTTTLFRHNTTPVDPHTGEPNDIYHVIARGAELSLQGDAMARKNGNGKWADEVIRQSGDSSLPGHP